MRIQYKILLLLFLWIGLSLKSLSQPPPGTLPSEIKTGQYYKWLHWGEFGNGLSLINPLQPKIAGVITNEKINITDVTGDPLDGNGFMGGFYYSAVNERFFVSFRRRDPAKTFIGFTVDTSHGLYYTHLSGDPMFQVDTSGEVRMKHLPSISDPNYIGTTPNGMLYIDTYGWLSRGPIVTGGGTGSTIVDSVVLTLNGLQPQIILNLTRTGFKNVEVQKETEAGGRFNQGYSSTKATLTWQTAITGQHKFYIIYDY